jgi:hypothetical protein
MERRKFIAGLGSLTAAGAVGLGTGAFSTQAERTMNIDVVGDGNAYLGLDPNTSSDYIEQSSPLAINLASNSGNGGSGLPEYSDTMVAPAFTLANQSNETLYVEVDNPLANNVIESYGADLDPSSDNFPNFGQRGGGRDRDLGVKGLDVQFFATGNLPITSNSALIGRDEPPENSGGLGGEFDDIGSNVNLFGSSEGINNNRIDLTSFDAGALELESGDDVMICLRVVTQEVEVDIPSLDFRVEAYDSTDPLSYDTV